MTLPVRPSAGLADCSSTTFNSVASTDSPSTFSQTCTLSQTLPSNHTQVTLPTPNTSASTLAPEAPKPSVAPAPNIDTAANTAVSSSPTKVGQALPGRTVDFPVSTATSEIAMCAPIVSSSPLSSPISPVPAPPGAWVNDTPPVNKTVSRSPSFAESKFSGMPLSPGSSKSTASNTSKKRSRADYDDATLDKGAKQRKKLSASSEHAKVGSTPQPPSTRPTRNRKAPHLFTPSLPTPKKPATPRKSATIPRAWQPKVVTESTKSKLLGVDVYHMLLKDEAWTGLSVEQKGELFSLIPESNTNARFLREIKAGDNSSATRPFELRINSSEFRCDVATFLNELSIGCIMKSWQEYAQRAVVKRAAGLYDDWKDEETEVWWGQGA